MCSIIRKNKCTITKHEKMDIENPSYKLKHQFEISIHTVPNISLTTAMPLLIGVWRWTKTCVNGLVFLLAPNNYGGHLKQELLLLFKVTFTLCFELQWHQEFSLWPLLEECWNDLSQHTSFFYLNRILFLLEPYTFFTWTVYFKVVYKVGFCGIK